MASTFGLTFQLAGLTPITNLGNWQVVGPTIRGLLEFERVTGTAKLIGATGGTLDVVLQTSHADGAVGSWKDIWRCPQILAGAAASALDVILSRAASATATTTSAVNPTDNPPTIGTNTVFAQSMGDSLRLIVLPGAGTTAGAQLTFFLNASP